jgi:hypothetical protein
LLIGPEGFLCANYLRNNKISSRWCSNIIIID